MSEDEPVFVGSKKGREDTDDDFEVTGSHIHPSAFQPPPAKRPRVESSSSNNGHYNGAIDLTGDTTPVIFRPPSPSPDERLPVCIGSIDTQALIMYPLPMLEFNHDTAALVNAREVRVDLGGREFLKVKLKYKKPAPGDANDKGQIAISDSRQRVQIGTLLDSMQDRLREPISKGLMRLEGYVERYDTRQVKFPFLNIIIFTLPTNVEWLSSHFAARDIHLDHPFPYYDSKLHPQSPRYTNPHNPPSGGWRSQRKTLPAIQSSAQMKQITQERQEIVDQVFDSIKGGHELPELDPGPFIKTKLFSHQKKAITFLQQREGEKEALELVMDATAATAAGSEAHQKLESATTPDDSSTDGGDDRRLARKLAKRKEKEFRKKGFNSLWVAQTSANGKVTGWKNIVSEQVKQGKNKPDEAKGAILADDMGLGKTLSIVSLIASTLKSARKFGELDVTEVDSSSSDDSGSDSDVSVSHFSGAVFGMPTKADEQMKRVRSGKPGDQEKLKFSAKKILKLEARNRAARLVTRSRATLLVCPLTTMNNWEDQIKEHWAGDLEIYNPDGKLTVDVKGTEINGPKKGPLKVYIYHGPARMQSPQRLADYDIVITTFSTLQTEYSKQVKTSDAGSSYVSRNASATTSTQASEDDDVPMELDEDKVPLVQGSEKPQVAAERISLQAAGAKNGKRPRTAAGKELLGPKRASEKISPLQAIEWFRVVLDEAHFIKDPKTIVCRAACYLEADRRLCLTGTPIQNKIDDVWALLKFLRFSPFDDRTYWSEHIMSRAKAGDSVGVVRLQALLKYITLRRTKDQKDANGRSILDLKPRNDAEATVILTKEEREVYGEVFRAGKEEFEKTLGTSSFSFVNMLHQILRLRQICDHTSLMGKAEDLEADLMEEGVLDIESCKAVMKESGLSWRLAHGYVAALKSEDQAKCSHCRKELELIDLNNQNDEEEATSTAAGSSKGKGKGRSRIDPPIVVACSHVFCIQCFRQQIFADWGKKKPDKARECPICKMGLQLGKHAIDAAPGARLGHEWSSAQAKRDSKRLDRIRSIASTLKPSSKMTELLVALKKTSELNPLSDCYNPHRDVEFAEIDPETRQPIIVKTVVFSQWTSMLDLIEAMLMNEKIGYARLDGTMKREERTEAMDELKNSPRCEVLLVSLRAGGVGLNLTAASRCYIVDPYWNPSVENQAIDRVHRMGQRRSVDAIRLIAKDTIENDMQKIQLRKTKLAETSLSLSANKKALHAQKMEELREIFK